MPPFPHLVGLAVLFLVIFAVSYGFTPSSPSSPKKDHTACPRRIWTYLPTPSPTPRQQECIASWKRHHPDHEIHVLTPTTVHGFVRDLPDPSMDAPLLRDPDRWSEAIALHVLYEHGGIWLDPHTYIRRPLDGFPPEKKEVAGFHYTRPPFQPTALVMDKRALASQPRIPLIKQWRDEYMRLLLFPSVEAYLTSITTQTPLDTFTFPVDWVMALALQHTLLIQPYPMESVHLLSVETGPLRHEQEGRGDPKKAEAVALRGSEPIVFLSPLRT